MKKASFTLVWTETFVRTARKFLRKHPDLAKDFRDALRQLETDPHVPKLRLHALSGKYKGKCSVSLTYAYRVILVLRIIEHEIVLLDVGSHAEVYE
ncbi:MAG: type II toxin-antitoxin system mRNA interferase toxin, RelE/StbE family [bacterium]